ncbi:MAG: LacI family DNA-binding transcriptional regulator [Sphaerochaetaceae bacterium]
MATIRDIAKLAGVSKTTVARALNNDGYVKEETKKRIEKAVKELNYTPNHIAKVMRTNKSATIGIFIPDYANPFYAELFKGIEEVTRKAGYMNLVCQTAEQSDVELFYIKELLKRQIDGIIYCTYNESNEGQKYLQKISRKTPIVCMDPVFRDLGLSCVVSDGYNGTKQAVKKLIVTGSKQIAYIKGPEAHAVTKERFQGYRDALIEAGIPINEKLIFESLDFKMASGSMAANYFISLRQKPEAVMAATDVLAIGALKEFRRRKIEIPNELRIVGFDNIPLASLVEPSMTTVAQPISQLGVTAAQLLIQKINNNSLPEQQIVLECTLVERDST